MKAWILYEVDKIKYQETDIPELQENEVLVAVKAAGICGSDIPRIYKDGAHKMPLIPGHEFSGEVVRIGTNVEKSWLQKRVGVYPLIPCRECVSCQKSQFEMCKQYSYLGSRRDGGFAQYVAVPVQNLIVLPDSVSYEQATMLEPMAVAVHAMGRVKVAQTDTVVVYGLGTIGLLLVMFLLEQGITNVFAIGNKDSQRDAVVRIGLSEAHFCNSREQNVAEWMVEKTNQLNADVVFECVGKSEIISEVVALAAASGRICMVGNPHSDIHLDKQIYWKILRNQLTVTGTWNSSFFHSISDGKEDRYDGKKVDWEYVLQKLEQGCIQPQKLITHQFSIQDLETGFQIMRDKTEESIKIIMKI